MVNIHLTVVPQNYSEEYIHSCEICRNINRMPTEIITKEDLNDFREKLLEDIKRLLGKSDQAPKKSIEELPG